AANSRIVQLLHLQGWTVFALFALAGVLITLLEGTILLEPYAAALRSGWLWALIILFAAYLAEMISTLLSGACKSVYGRELLLESGVLEASVESAPDSNANTTVKTLPAVEIRSHISLAMD